MLSDVLTSIYTASRSFFFCGRYCTHLYSAPAEKSRPAETSRPEALRLPRNRMHIAFSPEIEERSASVSQPGIGNSLRGNLELPN